MLPNTVCQQFPPKGFQLHSGKWMNQNGQLGFIQSLIYKDLSHSYTNQTHPRVAQVSLSQFSNRQAFRREGFVSKTDLRGLESVAYESDRPKSGSSISKPHSHPSNRQVFRRDGFAPEPDLRGLERVVYESDAPKSGSSISKPHSQFSNRQASRRDGFVAEPDLRRLEPVAAYESDRPKSVSSISKPHIHPSNREPYRRDDARGLLGSPPRFYGQSQTRQQGPSPGYRRNGRLEYWDALALYIPEHIYSIVSLVYW